MANPFQFYVVNAFAEKSFEGNPAGVFPNAVGLSDGQMQAIAKQLNLVETVFVLPPTVEGADLQLRYFMPEKELPIAGHPTIATWWALVMGGHVERGRTTFQQQTKLGLQEIVVEPTESSVRVLMQQREPRFLGTVEDRVRVAKVFGIEESDILPELPVEAVTTGLGHLVFAVRSMEALMRVRRNIGPLKELCSEFGVAEAQIFCRETYDPAMTLHTRNICPREGIEDPACGVGTSALTAYLMKHKVLGDEDVEVFAEQGHIEKMPSVIFVRGRAVEGTFALTIGGTGVLMVKGEFLV